MKRFGILLGLMFSIPVLAQSAIDIPLLGAEKSDFHSTYTWADFLQGKSCREDFNALQQLSFLSPQQQALRDKMQTYCQGQVGAWDTLLSLFRQNKKALLIDQTLQENGPFMGYIKALPYYLFDIHNTQATGSTLFAKLDKIQNAIEAKNPEEVVLLMQDLSPKEQLFFIPLFNEANALIDFKQALNGEEVLF